MIRLAMFVTLPLAAALVPVARGVVALLFGSAGLPTTDATLVARLFSIFLVLAPVSLAGLLLHRVAFATLRGRVVVFSVLVQAAMILVASPWIVRAHGALGLAWLAVLANTAAAVIAAVPLTKARLIPGIAAGVAVGFRLLGIALGGLLASLAAATPSGGLGAEWVRPAATRWSREWSDRCCCDCVGDTAGGPAHVARGSMDAGEGDSRRGYPRQTSRKRRAPGSEDRPQVRRSVVWCLVCVLVGVTIVGAAEFLGDYPRFFELLSTAMMVGAVGYALWRFRRDHEELLPVCALVAGTYAVYFGLPVLVHSSGFGLVRLVPETNIARAAVLAGLGIVVYVVAYYHAPIWRVLPVLPGPSRGSPGTASTRWALVLAYSGVVAQWLLSSASLDSAIGQLAGVVVSLGVLGLALLVVQDSCGYLSRPQVLAAAVAFLLLATFSLASGFLNTILRYSLALLFAYAVSRRRVPWRLLVVGVLVGVLAIGAKPAFRQIEWGPGGPVQAQTNAIQSGLRYFDVMLNDVAMRGATVIPVYANTVLSRFDLLRVFGAVVWQTPSALPFLEGETYAGFAWKLVPRALAPEKPTLIYGSRLAQRYGFTALSDNLTNVGFSQLVEFYINYGIAGLVVGMACLGMLTRWFLRSANVRSVSGVGVWRLCACSCRR